MRKNEWLSISDLMTSLMLIFLFVAISYVDQVQDASEKLRGQQDFVTRIAEEYDRINLDISSDLEREFGDDLAGWNAELVGGNIVRFRGAKVNFEKGDVLIRPRYREVLNEFFPRYVNLLANGTYRDSIREIRIEGHASSEWALDSTSEESYIRNSELSQGRAFSVLEYCFLMRTSAVERNRDWLVSVLRASGFSFSKVIRSPDGLEDPVESRRVEFQVVVEAETRLKEILAELDDSSIGERPAY